MRINELNQDNHLVNLTAQVIEIHDSEITKLSGKTWQPIYIQDDSASICLVLWNNSWIDKLHVGDTIELHNCVWRINEGIPEIITGYRGHITLKQSQQKEQVENNIFARE